MVQIITSVVTSSIIVGIVMFLLRDRLNDKGFVDLEKFEEDKRLMENTLVRKEVCTIQHNQINEALNEIKTDLKKLLNR